MIRYPYPGSSETTRSCVAKLFAVVYFCFVFASLAFASDFSHAAGKLSQTGVAWPEVREPYNQVFLSLRDGVATITKQKPVELTLADSVQPEDLLKWINNNKIDRLVLLGNKGLQFAQQVSAQTSIPVVVGGTFIHGDIAKQNIVGVSMAPDPAKLFAKLQQLFPAAKTVRVVYEPEDAWLVKRAKKSASDMGLDLLATEAGDIRSMAGAYRTTLQTQKSKTEALWLPYSGKSLEKVLLNEVLEVAWKRDLTVFSSNLADVNKGILFSLYSNNESSGQQLAELLNSQSLEVAEREYRIHLSQHLHAALNTRTAEHLGLRLGTEEKSEYKILFPLKR